MKNITRLTVTLLPVITLLSCGNRADSSSAKDSVITDLSAPGKKISLPPAGNFSGCYLYVSGTGNRDTALLNLKLDGENAEGEYRHAIYEKDERRGIFHGVLKDSIVNAVWSFTQEGRRSSLPLVFKLDGNGLYQKRFSYESKSGREYIADTSSFSIPFKKIPCNPA